MMVPVSRRRVLLTHEPRRSSGSAAPKIEYSGGRVRSANLADTPELMRLVARACASELLLLREAGVQGWLDRGHLLVLDDGEALRAAAFVEIEDGRARLELLVVDPPLIGRGIEERMIGVADALCEALDGRGTSLAYRDVSVAHSRR